MKLYVAFYIDRDTKILTMMLGSKSEIKEQLGPNRLNHCHSLQKADEALFGLVHLCEIIVQDIKE